MDRFKGLVIGLLFCGIFQLLSGPVGLYLVNLASEGSVSGWGQSIFAAWSIQIISLIAWIPVAIWVYNNAKKYLFGPILWALLILVLHTNALVIYLLIELYFKENK